MTHGGKLVIDTKHGEAALKSKDELWIGGGGVALYNKNTGFSDHSVTPALSINELASDEVSKKV